MKQLIASLIVIGLLIIFLETLKTGGSSQKSELEYTEQGIKAPELVNPQGYLNTDNITISSLKGKVVLVDFWTYTCINCIRTIPHLVDWYNKYHDKGLEIIGVHTPEFNFEKDISNVRKAVLEHGIKYPVVLDNDYETWNAYQNRYWPHKYLIDANGIIRYDAIGEGRYDVTEQKIRELLTEAGQDLSGVNDTQLTDETPRTPNTPELYAGYEFALPRGQNVGNPEGMQPNKIVNYTFPGLIQIDTIYLEGLWLSSADNLIAESDGTIKLYYKASKVNAVGEGVDGNVSAQILLNGAPISASVEGSDVKNSTATFNDPRLYNLVSGDYGQYVLEIRVGAGFALNSFTFG